MGNAQRATHRARAKSKPISRCSLSQIRIYELLKLHLSGEGRVGRPCQWVVRVDHPVTMQLDDLGRMMGCIILRDSPSDMNLWTVP